MNHKDIFEHHLRQLNQHNPELAKQIATQHGLSILPPLPQSSTPNQTTIPPQPAASEQQVTQNPAMLSLFSQFNEIVMEPLGHEDFSKATRILNAVFIGKEGDLSETVNVINSSFIKYLQTDDGKDIVRMAVSGFLKDFDENIKNSE